MANSFRLLRLAFSFQLTLRKGYNLPPTPLETQRRREEKQEKSVENEQYFVLTPLSRILGEGAFIRCLSQTGGVRDLSRSALTKRKRRIDPAKGKQRKLVLPLPLDLRRRSPPSSPIVPNF